jgi:hypothetical protein
VLVAVSITETLTGNSLFGNAYGRAGASQKQAHEVKARLENAPTKEILKTGLHEFITVFIEDNDRLGQTINGQYLLH